MSLLGWPKLMIGRWLGRAAKWIWDAVKDDIVEEIIGELVKPKNASRVMNAGENARLVGRSHSDREREELSGGVK